MKIIPIYDCNRSSEENEVIEETPIKESELCPSDLMAREIQRLSLRLRSSTPCKIFFSRKSLDNG